MQSARWGHTEVVRALLAAPGIDLNKVNKDGMTAVMLAASRGHIEVVMTLLAAPGIDINKRATRGEYEGKMALGIAIDRNHYETAALLRAAGAEE